MKTGILGGTFDPIHTGHLILAEEAIDAAGLSRVILLPTGTSYFKDGQHVTDAKTRYEMTCLAAEGNPRLLVSDIETNRPGNTYTVDSLRCLHEEYPADELYYIVGADTLVQMDLWKDPEDVFRLCTVLVQVRRDEVPEEALQKRIAQLQDHYGANILVIPARNVEISSTDIRKRVAEGLSIRYLVPEAVRLDIERRGLYRDR